MSTQNSKIIEKMREELEKFLQDQKSSKEFSQCMSESNSWLESREKK